MVKIKSIKKKHYKGRVYDITLKNDKYPYFYANGILTHNSLYPHIMIMCNLYGRRGPTVTEGIGWTGGGVWKTDGSYDTEKLHGVGKLFQKWYKQRLEYKANNDKREYSIKIILNASYGIMKNIFYHLVYDIIAAGDCTSLGRQWTKYGRKIFRKYGYIICNTDTDSFYIVDPFNDYEKLTKVKDEIINYIKSTVPFPVDTFDMEIEDSIKYMFFFKGKDKLDKDTDSEMDEQDFIDKPKGFLKKNYIYVTKKGKVVIKNLGIKKKSTSAITRKIFYDYLVPKIKEGQIKFTKTYFKNLVKELLEKDLYLAAMRKEVGKYEQYAVKSPNSLPGQISRKYGSGIHFLIPNLKSLGVGKGKSFCTIEEFKEHKLTIDDIDLRNFWMEINYFLKPVVTKNIFDYEIKK